MMLVASADEPSHVLNLVDLIQRLGVSYHFENEITEALQQSFMDDSGTYDDELHNVALRFRLLRQQGFNVSCGMFFNFLCLISNWFLYIAIHKPMNFYF